LFSSSTVGVAICDRQLRFRAINNALASMNGVPAKAHLGKTIHAVLGKAAAKIEPAYDHVFSTGESLTDLELSAQLPTRKEIGYWRESYFPIMDEVGTVRQVGAIVLEVTPRKELESSVSRLAENLIRAGSNLRVERASTLASRDPDSRSRLLKVFESCLSEAQAISGMLRAAALTDARSFRAPGLAPAEQFDVKQERDFAHAYATEDEQNNGSLSAREREVIRLVARGNTNREVAALLTISVRTVETHRARIMLKLDLHSVTDLVLFALRNNLIQP
jgi:DNA-binding CsgD family transcriptional regulator